ncbi:MAG: hypothetical protein MUF42_00340 [Cytophagaceae bacterium]|jgi:hypothetical protein|nr:hypothetical protein [Cytophagaceae bacterium]
MTEFNDPMINMKILFTTCRQFLQCCLLLLALQVFAQDSAQIAPVKLEHQLAVSPEYFKRALSKLDVGGYYRGYFFSRKLKDPYDGWTAAPVMRGGDIYQNPFLFFYLGGSPMPGLSLGSEVYLGDSFDAFLGTTQPRRTGPFNTMVLRGTADTKYGSYYLRFGGIEWVRLSPFTFGGNVGYNRYSVWERQPWDPAGNVKGRYASYYHTGTINQDIRFGTNAFKGFILNVTRLPFRLSADVFYGMSQNNGGFDRENIVMPKSNLGIRVNKNLGNNSYVSLNTFNSTARSDSINSTIDVQWQIFTSEFFLNKFGFNLNGEVGYGFYESPNYKRAWGEGIILNLRTPEIFGSMPFDFRFFRISKNFTSNVAQFQNTSNPELNNGFLGTFNLQPFGGNLTGVGGLANNRQGGAINTEGKIGKLKIIGGIQFESEINKLPFGRQLTYSHRINSLAWSRMAYNFPALIEATGDPYRLGPNQRIGTFYRGVYEIVNVNALNPDSTPISKNHYASLDLQLKYKNKILGKDVYYFLLSSAQSAQNKFSILPVFGEAAFISSHAHEAEAYVHIARDLVISGYYGLEFTKGNKKTDLTTATTGRNGQAGLSRDQMGRGVGMGADLTLSNSTSIYFRHRWIRFQDNSFKDEDFKGYESTVELKIFF